jgi:hypothetical protein
LEEIEREDNVVDSVKRPERPSHDGLQNDRPTDRQNGHQNGHQRPERPPVARKEPGRQDNGRSENEPQKDHSGDGGLPFRINQSSGDEKW